VRRLGVVTLLAIAAVAPACSRASSGEPGGGSASASASASAPASTPAPASALAPESAPALAPAPDAAVLTGPGSLTKLLDPGQPPRRKVRYAWHADQKELLLMDLATTATTEIAGSKQPEIPLPRVHVAVDVDPTRVAPDGALSFVWRVSAATVSAGAPGSDAMASGMRDEVAAIEHLSGRGTLTARGLAQDVTVDAASVVDAGTTGQMVEQVRQTLRDVAVPWPEEEIGKGARWQKISQLDAKGSRLTQTDTYTLAAIDASTGTVDDVLAQTAPPQVLRTPGASSGADARMESMLASGTSKVQFDLGRLVPRSTFDGTTTMVLSGGDVARRITMVMHVGIGIEGKPR
jgi:hypothetical protein